MNSNNRTVQELVLDDSFINYCHASNEEDVLFWETYLELYPHEKPTIESARILVLTLHEVLAKKIEEQNKRIDGQELELNNYKDHMRESQKRQWEVLDKHEKEIIETNHNLELCRQQNQKGGNKDV